MTTKTKFSHKLLSLFLSIIIILACLPLAALTASAESRDSITRIADSSTMNGWQEFFPTGDNINTENAGGIWTDKSVFKDDTAFPDITMTDKDSFLVALSAMGSNMSITGMSSVPTDTMLVLDVSGSMEDNASALVTAANDTVATLLDSNKYSRVGIVLYSGPSTATSSSGNNATLILPLGRYTTSATDGDFLNISGNTISLDSRVVYEGTTQRPATSSKNVVGGTYIQNGIALAKNQFTATNNETTVANETIGTVKRKPIMVLMSDGAPTLATTNFTNPQSSNMGNGTSTNAAMGFSTQLTMSYAKYQIEEKYQTDSLFYTLGVGLTSGSDDYQIARSVLNPSNTYTDASANALRTHWSNYNNANVNASIRISGRGNNARNVTKISTPLEQYFVDRYFAASGANDMISAFQKIVSEIALQSKYFPTLTEENENLSGYITFQDKIGKYMEVTKIEGIRLHQTLFSGADLASNFVAGGGALGTYDNPTELGNEMVHAVMQRIGTPDVDTARTLIGLAYNHGQLSYESATKFSNYIGWFADENSKFLGFWYDGIPTDAIPANAKFIMKSYGYLGETDETHGVAKSDMMYATVQVKEDIATKEQTVTFAIPAALIPTVTYEVTLGETGSLENLKTSGATAPIRLVYKVSLRKEINEYTVKELVDSEYIAANKNPDGSINFYSNQYEVDNSTGYQKVNTFSYFRPSRENDRYYYQDNVLVYTDTNGTLYHGDTAPTGEMYHGYTVYYKNGNEIEEKTVYHRLTSETLETAHKTENSDTWYIPIGDVRRDYAGFVNDKEPSNITGTLPFSAAPFTDIYGHSVDDTSHSFVVGATLGNNGKLTLSSETGIKLSKKLADGIAATDESFGFILTNTTNTNDNSNYPAYKIDANGTATDTGVQFVNGAAANIFLKANEILYIGGMNPNDVITVKEIETDKYTVASINETKGDSINITIEENTLKPAAFVNTERGLGNLTIAKDVEHKYGNNYQIPDNVNSFDIEVTLKLNGNALSNKEYEAKQTSNASVTKINTDANGKFTFTLKDDDQLEIFGLPAGTIANVKEINISNGFTATYWDNGASGDGIVDIIANHTVSVEVVNVYEADEVFPVNITLNGTKEVTGRTPNAWTDDDVYSFVLEQYNFTTQAWEQIGTKKTVNKNIKTFTFNEVFSDTNFKFTEIGTYYYRVREEIGTVAGISYDTGYHSFAVVVADDNMDGKLEIKSVEETADSNTTAVDFNSGTYNVTTSFTNIYNDGEVDAAIEINKTVFNPTESTLVSLEGFNFKMTANGNNPSGDPLANEPENAITVITSKAGIARFHLNFTEVGEYNYTVRELNGNKLGYSYDMNTVYNIKITTSSVGGIMTQQTTVTKSGAPSSLPLKFENKYLDGEKANLPIDFIAKKLNGRELKANEFNFELTSVNSSMLIDKNGNPITKIEGSNKADGSVEFNQPLYFNKVGRYFYNINEVAGSLGGITYDNNTFRVVVEVTDAGGKLEATYQIINVESSKATFVNEYTAAPVPNTISGKKELTGRALLNAEFSFVLTEADDEHGTVSAGAKTYTAENNLPTAGSNIGEFKFPEIIYTKAGKYYYVVTEQDSSDGATYGITYDDTKFIVTVTIIDDGDGHLEVGPITYAGASEIKFTNKYKANPTSAVIPGNKILEGRVLNDAEFSFELYNSNSDWDTKSILESVENSENGSFEFNAIDFDTAGTYYYLVKETNGNKGGVTYDQTVYRIKVEITDDLLGQLHSSVFIYDDNGIPQSDIVFVNSYAVTGNEVLKIDGTKTLNGRDLIDGEFEFELYETDNNFSIDGDAYKTVTNKSGKFEFKLEYAPEDIGKTFYYVAKEKNSGKTINNITYSNTEYHITVKVEDNLLGKIQTTATIKNGTATVKNLEFVNEFENTPPKPPKTPNTPKSPQTGDSSNLTLWLALLFVSGGGIIGVTCSKKKKKEEA